MFRIAKISLNGDGRVRLALKFRFFEEAAENRQGQVFE
jgi:hypothetical protein